MMAIILAFLNGIAIGTSRTMNGKLAHEIGALKASLYNHVVGFLFLSIIMIFARSWLLFELSEIPLLYFSGGIIGAFFVALSSFVFPRLGAMNAGLMVISGQMFTATVLDWSRTGQAPADLQWIGIILVLLGTFSMRKFK